MGATINQNSESPSPNLAYGGVSPMEATQLATPINENKVIYGGADPLVGTGVIPTIQNQELNQKKSEDIESL